MASFCYYKLQMNYKLELATAKQIANEAGQIMRQYFRGDQGRVIKQDGSPLTVADTSINRMVIERLQASFPDDGIIGEEESTSEYGMGRKWFCDPIDGTKAFTWGVPTAMFSLALVLDGKPIVGVCYEPMLDQMYWAVKTQGAYCGDQLLNVNQDSLTSGILAIPSNTKDITKNPVIASILESGVTTAVFSGAVYKASAVADGRFVGYVETKVNAHDMAAIQVVIEEAGGRVTDLNGQAYDYSKPFSGTIVSNGLVHGELEELVNRIKK